jgi:hypothetical protein
MFAELGAELASTAIPYMQSSALLHAVFHAHENLGHLQANSTRSSKQEQAFDGKELVQLALCLLNVACIRVHPCLFRQSSTCAAVPV